MNEQNPLEQFAEATGGKIEFAGMLPDGSGFGTVSYPLPANHWLTLPGYNVTPMPFRMGTDHPLHNEFCAKIREAGKYAYRSATMNGKEEDIDPDALLQNLIVGLIGYHTPDGTSQCDPWANPDPIPPLAFVATHQE